MSTDNAFWSNHFESCHCNLCRDPITGKQYPVLCSGNLRDAFTVSPPPHPPCLSVPPAKDPPDTPKILVEKGEGST